MTIEARIRELGNRHRNLDETIRREMIHPATDSLHVRELKQQIVDQLKAKGRGASQLVRQLEDELSPEYEPDPVKLLAQMGNHPRK